MFEELKYTDEADKSLGVAGMAIALLACDSENYIAAVSIEDGEETIDFTPEAFFITNPRFSAKITWNRLMKEYQIYSGMLMGNVICRFVQSHRRLSPETIDLIHDIVREHGCSVCELESDEIDTLFNKDLAYFNRLFNHPSVFEVARDFALTLQKSRRMSAGDVFESLSRLSAF